VDIVPAPPVQFVNAVDESFRSHVTSCCVLAPPKVVVTYIGRGKVNPDVDATSIVLAGSDTPLEPEAMVVPLSTLLPAITP
jgi:hypothetical protein